MASHKPLTLEQAKAIPLSGWNIRCNLCGSYGAVWILHILGQNARIGWGSLALCPYHEGELDVAIGEIQRLRKINFEQDHRKPGQTKTT